MVNTSPRRMMPKRSRPQGDRPWRHGDPTRKIGLNTPIDEPLMLMLDYLVENKAIYSKASFIRDVVTKAAQEEIDRLDRVREAMSRIEAKSRRK